MDPEFLTATIKMVVTLVLITCVIFLLVLFLKRFRSKALSNRGLPQMRLSGILNLAPKRSVALVEVQGEWLVLGVGTETVTLLTRLSRPPAAWDQGETPGRNLESENGTSDPDPA